MPTSPVCLSEQQNRGAEEGYRGNVCPLCLSPVSAEGMAEAAARG